MLDIPRPTFRPLRIYATDPARGYKAARTATITVENEELSAGPIGARLEVVDYDAERDLFYDAVNLNDPSILMQSGLPPSEADPHFHQQMVYAIASRTLTNFDRALGRRVSLRKGEFRHKLRLLPHAFEGENAFYDHDLNAILFGYFTADPAAPGPNIPNQTIFTCLSHDIIVHEMTHAIVDHLRRYFLEPSNVDVLAFHEGFSDLVALLQHFSYRDLLIDEIRVGRGDILDGSLLVNLAKQFGEATGTGKALRSAIDTATPDPRRYGNLTEPHARGAILVAAVFDGFLTTFRSRIADLVRIATGGSGRLPPGELHPDLVARIASEAAQTAQRQLNMCIRAFDYLPPVDITFGDYLRALVTADFELDPDDAWGQRAALIEGFRRRGIYPEGATSLAEESLRWPAAEPGAAPMVDSLSTILPQLLQREAARFTKVSSDPGIAKQSRERPPSLSEDLNESNASETVKTMREALVSYAQNNSAALKLTGRPDVWVSAFNAVFRVAPSGALQIELVAQFVETDKTTSDDPEFGGVPVRGGTTAIIGVDGHVRYIIAKPLPSPTLDQAGKARADARVAGQRAFVEQLDGADARTNYLDRSDYGQRMAARMNLRALHEGAE
ncbi:hypothetical protein IYY11_01995 [Methylocystis sp. H62]|uniref:hypothetical protein n=1 Tax=Methylocystis sp. H62 TaxID=2785789 RepID=UPI0018C222A0|nr:hypothetical protein [Methylocystis sp. H62]MBG0792245.1 hypothetical protein [Methylocystis sp. H62]